MQNSFEGKFFVVSPSPLSPLSLFLHPFFSCSTRPFMLGTDYDVELWNLMDFVVPGYLGTVEEFRRTYACIFLYYYYTFCFLIFFVLFDSFFVPFNMIFNTKIGTSNRSRWGKSTMP